MRPYYTRSDNPDGRVSVPLPGFSGLRHGIISKKRGRVQRKRFSPVAGIQWVETLNQAVKQYLEGKGFSPVAGIQWVETGR